MKCIVAGGRHYTMTDDDYRFLDNLGITEVVSGGCSGADKGGEYFANTRGLPIKRFPADWKVYGRAAGPIRNKAMAEYADAVVLFPGGRGTKSMKKEAIRCQLIIYER